MKVIWKFAITAGTGLQHVEMPRGAEILSIHLQDGAPHVWALCHPQQPRVLRVLAAFGTGDEVVADGPFVATLQSGYAVLHFFDFGEQNS